MMPDYLTLLDRVDRFLNPAGVFGVCDFYVSARESSSLAGVIGDVASRQCSWLSRWFWLHWFELDHVDLHPSRRGYLEHKFPTIKSYNARNGFVLPGLVSIPYYVSLHTSRRIDTAKASQAYEVDAGNTISASASPLLHPSLSRQHSMSEVPDLALGASAALSRTRSKSSASTSGLKRSDSRSSDKSDSYRIDIAPDFQLTAFHYGLKHFRVPYVDDPVHRNFRSYIYSFVWEDPRVDMEHIKLGKEDAVLCITSAGDNACVSLIAQKTSNMFAVC
jgi:betaine lipid synthase